MVNCPFFDGGACCNINEFPEGVPTEITQGYCENECSYAKRLFLPHVCGYWFDEAMGCSICSGLILKTPIKTKEDMLNLIASVHSYVGSLKEEIVSLKKQIARLKYD